MDGVRVEPKIVVKLVEQLDDKEFVACDNLNMRASGTMRDYLRELRRKKTGRDWAIMAWEDDMLVAWSLLFWRQPWGSDQEVYYAHFYTRHSHRRMGLATKLIKIAGSLARMPRVDGWGSVAATEFFKKHQDITEMI